MIESASFGEMAAVYIFAVSSPSFSMMRATTSGFECLPPCSFAREPVDHGMLEAIKKDIIPRLLRAVAGERRASWALVESVRTERGPRKKVVSWLGALDKAGRIGVLQAAKNQHESVKPQLEFKQQTFFEYEDARS